MISVCMCTYNGELFLKEQLDSIREQTLTPDEVVICDDASTDNTVPLIRAYIEEYGLQESWRLTCNEENKGYPANFYACMGACRGELVFPADQDDIWKPKKLEKMVTVMNAHPDISVLSCLLAAVDEQGQQLKGLLTPKEQHGSELTPVSVQEVLYKDCWAGMTLVYRNAFYRQIQSQVQDSSMPHDRALWTLAADRGGFYQLNETLVYHRRHEQNTCKEEHRIDKLMRYERKLQEIQVYMEYMRGFLSEQITLTAPTKEAVQRKLERLKVRYDNLRERRIFRILSDYGKHPSEIRLTTLLCDLGIVIFKR